MKLGLLLHAYKHSICFCWGSNEQRAGPQTQKLPNLKIAPDPTGAIHKKARGEKFDPKKIVFTRPILLDMCVSMFVRRHFEDDQ